MFQRSDDSQCLCVVIEPAMGLQTDIQRPLAGVAERGMAEVVRQRQRFRQILVKTELPGQGARDLCHLQRVGKPGPVVITLVEYEDLGFVLQAAKGGRVDDPIAIAPERAAGPAWRLGELPPAAAGGVAGVDRTGSRHSDRHDVLFP
jgi:hypothetical protein